MAEMTRIGLVQEVRGFGWRVFDLADRLSGSCDEGRLARLRTAAAHASRHLARRSSTMEERIANRETEMVFKRLCDAVSLLDQIAASVPEVAVDASALAAEATGLADRVYDMVEVA